MRTKVIIRVSWERGSFSSLGRLKNSQTFEILFFIAFAGLHFLSM